MSPPCGWLGPPQARACSGPIAWALGIKMKTPPSPKFQMLVLAACATSSLLAPVAVTAETLRTEKGITSMGIALDHGCALAGCPNLECTNKFTAGIGFYYGVTAPQNTRTAYKFFQMAKECGDQRAEYYLRYLDTNGHFPPEER